MAPTIHLVRHAQAVHNLSPANCWMRDPALTPLGESQCLDLRARFPFHSSISLLVTSPLRRTVQTTLLAFEPELSRGVQCIALSEIQETSGAPSDTGSDLADLKKDFKDQPVDFSLVPEDWVSKEGKWAPDPEPINARCREARKWFKARSEGEIVVVSHGGLLGFMTGDFSDNEKFEGAGWENAEFRTYRFVEGDDENASIEETAESRRRRRDGPEKQLTETEEIQLKKTTTQESEKQAYEKDDSSPMEHRNDCFGPP
ncbi:MAG: hypothetical protein Q9201_004891 [Fulgogasparrea decipioides]